DLTVVATAPDGTWGVATDPIIGRAIANAMAECKKKYQSKIGCGSRMITIRGGWSIGMRCGNRSIFVAEETLAAAREPRDGSVREGLAAAFNHPANNAAAKRTVPARARAGFQKKDIRVIVDNTEPVDASSNRRAECGRLRSSTTRIARPTAAAWRAKPRWRRSRRVGGGLAQCTGIQVPGATGLERATFGVTGRWMSREVPARRTGGTRARRDRYA